MEHNRETKKVAMAEQKRGEAAMAAKIDKLVARGEEEEYPSSAGWLRACFPLWKRGSRRVGHDAVDVAVFGQHAAKQKDAAARLEQAAEQVSHHAEQLADRASAARHKAQLLLGMGKKAEAIMSLKRAKGLEKQAEVAAATHAAIENQQDILQSSALQREIASALSASIATTKRKTRGLLEKTETAVDDSAEMQDTFDDISEVLGGLSRNEYEDDDILAELEGMCASEAAGEAESPAAAATIDPNLYPSAGKCRSEDKQSLLSQA